MGRRAASESALGSTDSTTFKKSEQPSFVFTGGTVSLSPRVPDLSRETLFRRAKNRVPVEKFEVRAARKGGKVLRENVRANTFEQRDLSAADFHFSILLRRQEESAQGLEHAACNTTTQPQPFSF